MTDASLELVLALVPELPLLPVLAPVLRFVFVLPLPPVPAIVPLPLVRRACSTCARACPSRARACPRIPSCARACASRSGPGISACASLSVPVLVIVPVPCGCHYRTHPSEVPRVEFAPHNLKACRKEVQAAFRFQGSMGLGAIFD